MTNNNAQEWEKRFVEEGAALEHARWSRWQAYLHKFLTYYEIKDGDRTIGCYLLSADAYERWERQIATDYKDLSEEEKESDRKEVREYLPLVTLSRKEARREANLIRQEAIEECKKCVPEEMEIVPPLSNIFMPKIPTVESTNRYGHYCFKDGIQQGHSKCRTETLSALEKLKDTQ